MSAVICVAYAVDAMQVGVTLAGGVHHAREIIHASYVSDSLLDGVAVIVDPFEDYIAGRNVVSLTPSCLAAQFARRRGGTC